MHHPTDLWKDHEEAWDLYEKAFDKYADGYKKEDHDYLRFCMNRCGEAIRVLKKYYISNGQDFNIVWKEYLNNKKTH